MQQQIGLDQLSELPGTHGVYYFLNDKREAVYVGKSVNIRQRVKSHFSAAKRHDKERKIVHRSRYIGYQQTPGELSALLLESFEIKRLLPIYNRRLRRRSKQYAWQICQHQPFHKLTLVEEQWPPSAEQQQYGSFRSLTHARKQLQFLVKQHQLCAKVLGIEASGQSCFGYQLNLCQGACVGQESSDNHNQRLQSALRSNYSEHWPFNGLLGVIEAAAPEEVNVFDAWHYLGAYHRGDLVEASDSNYLNELLNAQPPHTLDRDSYKIVLSFLRHKRDDIELLDFSLGN